MLTLVASVIALAQYVLGTAAHADDKLAVVAISFLCFAGVLIITMTVATIIIQCGWRNFTQEAYAKETGQYMNVEKMIEDTTNSDDIEEDEDSNTDEGDKLEMLKRSNKKQ